MILATVWTLPYGLWGLGDSHFEPGPVAAVLFLGVVGTGLAFVIMGTLVGRVGATRASMITYLIPVVALVLGVVFRDDVVAPLALVGVVFVIGGAFLASRSTRPLSGRRPAQVDERREDLADRADEEPVGVAVHRRLLTVDDDDRRTGRLGPRHAVGGREHAERRTDGEHHVALVAHPHRPLDHGRARAPARS